MNELNHILIRANKDIYRYLSGSNVSNFLGHGYDFAELVEYNLGDDIRDISWINSAKRGEIYVKKMHEEKDLSIVCLAIMDGRMVVGEKFETMLQAAASIGYLAHYQNDLFSGLYNLKESLAITPPSKSHQAIEHFLKQLHNQQPLGTTVAYNHIIQQLMEQLHQKSLIVLVGDFLDEVDLSTLAYKHDVVALLIRDKQEEQPIYQSNVELIDPTTNEASHKMLTPRAIKHYQKRLLEHDAKLIEHFATHRIRYTKIFSPDEIVEKFSRVFA
ncbi:MAG: DUF58 domain-containing protein [Campylobacterales bacterium]|nr:DUF58 domain-containing protein [Campylobacterales bacterium]